jgi:hypothetical protein
MCPAGPSSSISPGWHVRPRPSNHRRAVVLGQVVEPVSGLTRRERCIFQVRIRNRSRAGHRGQRQVAGPAPGGIRWARACWPPAPDYPPRRSHVGQRGSLSRVMVPQVPARWTGRQGQFARVDQTSLTRSMLRSAAGEMGCALQRYFPVFPCARYSCSVAGIEGVSLPCSRDRDRVLLGKEDDGKAGASDLEPALLLSIVTWSSRSQRLPTCASQTSTAGLRRRARPGAPGSRRTIAATATSTPSVR